MRPSGSATFEYFGARSATIESRALGTLKLASDENVPAKRSDFFYFENGYKVWKNSYFL